MSELFDLQHAKEVLKGLREPFPKEAIKKRDGGGGKKFDYVATHHYINRLNNVAIIWNSHILTTETSQRERIDYNKNTVIDTLVKLTVLLEIPGVGCREGIGVQIINDKAEDLWKGALSDAIKNACKLFGMGIDLYGPDYEDYSEQTVETAASKEPYYWAPCSECKKEVCWMIQPDGEYLPHEEDGSEHYHLEPVDAPESQEMIDDSNLLRVPD